MVGGRVEGTNSAGCGRGQWGLNVMESGKGVGRLGPSSGAQSPPWRKGGPCQASVGMPLPPPPPAGLPPSSLPLDHMFFQASWGTDDQADKPLSRGQGCLQKA